MVSGVLLPLTCAQPFCWTSHHEHPPSSQSVISLSFSPHSMPSFLLLPIFCLVIPFECQVCLYKKKQNDSFIIRNSKPVFQTLSLIKILFMEEMEESLPPPPKKACKSPWAASKYQKLGLHWTWKQGPREPVRSIWLARGFIYVILSRWINRVWQTRLISDGKFKIELMPVTFPKDRRHGHNNVISLSAHWR